MAAVFILHNCWKRSFPPRTQPTTLSHLHMEVHIPRCPLQFSLFSVVSIFDADFIATKRTTAFLQSSVHRSLYRVKSWQRLQTRQLWHVTSTLRKEAPTTPQNQMTKVILKPAHRFLGFPRDIFSSSDTSSFRNVCCATVMEKITWYPQYTFEQNPPHW